MAQSAERKREYMQERWKRQREQLRSQGAAWRDANRDRLKQIGANRRLTKRAMCLVASARTRARKRGLSFSLTEADIAHFQDTIDKGHCELSGVAFTLVGGRSATSPSLDRIVPSLGYVSGNVRVVCHALNAGMGDWGENELLRIVQTWLTTRSSPRSSSAPRSKRSSKGSP